MRGQEMRGLRIKFQEWKWSNFMTWWWETRKHVYVLRGRKSLRERGAHWEGRTGWGMELGVQRPESAPGDASPTEKGGKGWRPWGHWYAGKWATQVGAGRAEALMVNVT